MARKKIKLSWVVNENSRAISLKKRRLGLLKKVTELTILCDVKACMIMFSPNEAGPMVWPSVEVARDLLDDFFALPDIEKKKKEMNLESYLKEKTRKIHEQLSKSHKKNKEYVVDQLMVQLHHGGRRIDDLNLSEIYGLLSFSKEKILILRKRPAFIQYPPMHPFEVQRKEFRTSSNDVLIGGGQDDERFSQSHYLTDQWSFAPFEPPNSRNYIPFQVSSSNGNTNLEMEPIIGAPMITFHSLFGSVSQPLENHHNMNNNPIMAMNQPRQYSFDFMSRELGVKEEGETINNGDS